MRFVLNGYYTDKFRNEWNKFIDNLVDQNNHDKRHKTPSKPGAGWLTSIAAKFDICGATGMYDSEYVCCGNLLDKNIYYCNNHQKQYKNENHIPDIVPNQGDFKLSDFKSIKSIKAVKELEK